MKEEEILANNPDLKARHDAFLKSKEELARLQEEANAAIAAHKAAINVRDEAMALVAEKAIVMKSAVEAYDQASIMRAADRRQLAADIEDVAKKASEG